MLKIYLIISHLTENLPLLFLLKKKVGEPPELDLEKISAHNPTPEEEKNVKNLVIQITKTQTEKPFNFETKVGKQKIALPLSELAKHEVYRSQINRSLKISVNEDSVNIFDDQLELIFGHEVIRKIAEGEVPPFYVGLNIHDKILHNAMFDSGVSHNLMPKFVMEKLDLDITRPYKDLFSFDSSQVKCLGLIKDLCVSLVHYPTKTILMDIVVADIPPKYGMLLSRSWGAKLQRSLQLDMSYATILVFGQPKRLYKETLMKYVVSC